MPPKAKPTLAEEFAAQPKVVRQRCTVCFTVTPATKEFIEQKWNEGFGEQVIGSFLKRKGLWPKDLGVTPIRHHALNHVVGARQIVRRQP